MRRTRALVVLAPLWLGGCGGTSALSTSQLQSQATRVCTNARRETNRIPTPAAPAGGAAFLNRGIAVLAPELRALRSLHPPPDLAQVYSTSLSAFSQKLLALRATAGAMAAGGDAVISLKRLELRLAPLAAQEDEAWQALQVPACTGG